MKMCTKLIVFFSILLFFLYSSSISAQEVGKLFTAYWYINLHCFDFSILTFLAAICLLFKPLSFSLVYLFLMILSISVWIDEDRSCRNRFLIVLLSRVRFEVRSWNRSYSFCLARIFTSMLPNRCSKLSLSISLLCLDHMLRFLFFFWFYWVVFESTYCSSS